MMMKNRAIMLAVAAVSILLIYHMIGGSGVRSGHDTGNETFGSSSGTNADLTGVDVAIYESFYKYERIEESRAAMYNMFSWMNASVQLVNQTDLLNGCLWCFEVLVIPEGLGPFLESDLTDEGMQIIRDWVALGGSYVGVRGSTSIAVTKGYFEGRNETFELGLFNGTSVGMPDMGHTLATELRLNLACDGPDLSFMPATMTTTFCTGRYFEADEGQEMIVIAEYDYNNQPAMIASHYGDGNLFLSSPHFEYEEDDARDGTEYFDEYDDPDSEWPLILEITKWLLDDSAIVANQTVWPAPDPAPFLVDPTVMFATAGIAAVVVVVMLLVRAKR